jgi:capsular exopolysaccharide synthesis family protein
MSKVQTAVQRAKALRRNNDGKDASAISPPARLAPNHSDLVEGRKTGGLSVSTLPLIETDSDVLSRNRILTHDDSVRHPAQNAYRMLRTRLMQVMRTNQWQVFGVSSIRENEGKTFTAINLAISIAAEIEQEVILVDLDLRKPSVHEYFGIAPEDIYGLKDYLTDQDRDLENLLVCPGIDRLGLLLSAEPFERSSDLLASDRGTQLFAKLRGSLPSKTVVVVDLPPLLAADDALAVAPLLDALLLVVAEGQSDRADVQESRHILEAFTLLGTVLNKSVDKESRRKSYYY